MGDHFRPNKYHEKKYPVTITPQQSTDQYNQKLEMG